jgi:hypothetical protein
MGVWKEIKMNRPQQFTLEAGFYLGRLKHLFMFFRGEKRDGAACVAR